MLNNKLTIHCNRSLTFRMTFNMFKVVYSTLSLTKVTIKITKNDKINVMHKIYRRKPSRL